MTVLVGENVTFEIKIISDLHPSWDWFFQKCQEENCAKKKIEVKDRLVCLDLP